MDLRQPLIEATKKLKALRERLDELEARAVEPIAIVAAACRLPGGVDGPQSFWRLLDEGRDAIEPFPATRWSADELYDQDPDAPGKTYCTRGGFVRDVDQFDAAFFGIAPREAEAMDPAQRLALECAWELVERAGIRPDQLSHSATGVYLGGVGSDYEPWGGRRGMQGMNGYGFTGRDTSVLSGRVAFALGLEGPALTVNTACSSSLVALHLACEALRAGECELALCGGSQVMTTPGCFVEFSRLGALARDGRCKSFSDDADGVGWAEGCAMVLLQRLSDAVREDRPILALVRGTAVNQDGRSQGLTAPSGPAQRRVIERALAQCGLAPADIDAVEAHGTGTALGDPIEAGALASVFGPGRPAERPLYIGSCKSNIGHTQAASGIAGVIKIALALAHERLPCSLHAQRRARHVAWSDSGLQLLGDARSWPRGARVRRAGVNSFGISGTNAHVIVEEAPARDPAPAPAMTEASTSSFVPMVVSALDEPALAIQARRLADQLEREREPKPSPVDLAWSLASTRALLPARLALAVSRDQPASALASTLREWAERQPERPGPARLHAHVQQLRPGKLAMLFSGQGSQRARMGVALCAELPAFRADVDEICAELETHLPGLRELMFAAPGSEAARAIDRTVHAQPALFVVELALQRQWARWGVVPDLVLGHSLGELVAAHVAGVLSLTDACTLVAARARLMQDARSDGAMFSIAAPRELVVEQLVGFEDRLSIAALNGPAQTVISGDRSTALAIATLMREQGHQVKKLRVSHAFHSPHMDEILAPLRELAASLTHHPPRIELISNLSGALATPQLLSSPDYWVRQVRGTVRFCEGVRAAEALGADRLLECGPGGVLAALASGCVTNPSTACIASLREGDDEPQALAEAAARIHASGSTLDWDAVFAGQGARAISLPTYGFRRARYWLEGAGRDPRALEGAGLEGAGHPLLGAVTALPEGGWLFTARLDPRSVPWLAEHRVFDRLVVPGMVWIELLLHACARVGAGGIRELVLEAPLILDADGATIQLAIDAPDSAGHRAVRVHARVGARAWVRHAAGSLEGSLEVAEVARARAPTLEDAGVEVDISDLYERLADQGLGYGPAFRGLRSLRRSGRVLSARVVLPEPLRARGYGLHPALLDASLHAVLAVRSPDADGLPVPFELEQVRMLRPLANPRELQIHVALEQGGDAAAISWTDLDGEPVADIARIGFRVVSPDKLERATPRARAARRLDHGQLYRQVWTDRPAAARPRRASCALVGRGPASNEIAVALRSSGVELLRFDHARALLVGLRGRGESISTVVRVADSQTELADADAARRATTNLVAELREWTRDQGLADRRYVLLTTSAVATESRARCKLEQAPLWGLLRTLRSERPDHQWLVLDHDRSEASDDTLADALFATDVPEAALRGGRRLVPSLVPVEDDPQADDASPDLGRGTVLVTGGTSGLGAAVARHLAARHGVTHLLLVSRRGPDTPGAAALVNELDAAGCAATLAACDVSRRDALERLLDEIPPERPLSAVFHCAAVLDDGLADAVSADGVARVFGPKLGGAWHLHELTQTRELSALVLFSSIAGLIGHEGQMAYAAANVGLDALSASRRAAGLPGLSLAWGPWAELGMAARLPALLQARLHDSGLAPLSVAAGLELLDRALQIDAHLLAPLQLDRAALRDDPERPLAHLLTGLAPPPAAIRETAAPRTRQSLPASLDAAPAPARVSALIELVRAEAASVLQLSEPAAVHEDRPLDELGMDSLMAIDIRRRLERRLDRRLPATLVFEHRSCRAIAEYLGASWTSDTTQVRS